MGRWVLQVRQWSREGIGLYSGHWSAPRRLTYIEPRPLSGLVLQMKNEAEARRQQYILEGQGEAEAIRLRAEVRPHSQQTCS